MTGTGGGDVLYTRGQGTQQLYGVFVTTNAFQFLGVPALLGRWITPEDGKAGAAPVFMMNYRLMAGTIPRRPEHSGNHLHTQWRFQNAGGRYAAAFPIFWW